MIRILTDSTSDILPEEGKKMGVEIIPLNVTFENGVTYKDGIELTHDEFYVKLEKCKELPVTSQPSPEQFLEKFNDAKNSGDDVIAIVISANLSGTFQSATIAAEECGYDRIFIVDSGTVTMGINLLVKLALQLRDKNLSTEEIVKILNEEKDKIRILAVVNELKYLQKGGRLSKAAAFAGGILGIKPIIVCKNGTIKAAGKARKMAEAVEMLFKLAEQEGGIDKTKDIVAAYGADKTFVEDILNSLSENLGIKNIECRNIGTVVGTHVGPKAAGFSYFAENITD